MLEIVYTSKMKRDVKLILSATATGTHSDLFGE